MSDCNSSIIEVDNTTGKLIIIILQVNWLLAWHLHPLAIAWHFFHQTLVYVTNSKFYQHMHV